MQMNVHGGNQRDNSASLKVNQQKGIVLLLIYLSSGYCINGKTRLLSIVKLQISLGIPPAKL